ncbi:30S ribosomal protein S13 [bacterium]|nr:MAG: 30S ribosomal protein S13 [bacterium]
MARLLGIEIPNDKRIEIALTYIYGVGPTKSAKILEEAKIDPSKKARSLTIDEIDAIKKVIEKLGIIVEGDLRRFISLNIKRLKDIGCYKGIRHQKNLPVRGQRTKTNSRTRRGNVRVSAGSGKKSANQKT